MARTTLQNVNPRAIPDGGLYGEILAIILFGIALAGGLSLIKWADLTGLDPAR